MSLESSPTLQLRAAASSYWVLGAILALPLLVCLAAAVRQPSFRWPAAIWAGCGALAWTWLKSVCLTIENGRLQYRTLFRGTRQMALSDVEHAEVEVGLRRYFDRFKPPYRLVIRSKPRAGRQTWVINLKLFRRDDLRRLLALLDIPRSGTSDPVSL